MGWLFMTLAGMGKHPTPKAYLDNLKKNPRPAMGDAMIAQIRKIPPQMIEQMMAAAEVPLGTLAARFVVEMALGHPPVVGTEDALAGAAGWGR